MSCIELSTFIKWLECLFAAIDLAAPIDDRDFPRDMSIPRIQRVRWFRGQSPALPGYTIAEPPRNVEASAPDGEPSSADADAVEATAGNGQDAATSADSPQAAYTQIPATRQPLQETAQAPPRVEPPARRLSTTSYTNTGVDPHSGKWLPENKWTNAHDLLYAKLCYSNLLFRSPRKSNYIISKGKQWFVDWGTGKMVRVLPPTYGESDFFGPWQVIHTENPRI